MRVGGAVSLVFVLGFSVLAWLWLRPTPSTGPDRTNTVAASLLDQILERNHGPRRGSFGHSIVQFRVTRDANPTLCSIQAPDRFRIDYPGDGGHFVLRGAESWSREGAVSVDISAEDLERTRRMRTLVRGLLLLPLYDALDVTHLSNGRLELTTTSDGTWSVNYDPTTLAVLATAGPDGQVTIHDRHDSGAMFMPLRVTIGDLQDHLTRINATDVQFDEATFQRPEERTKPKRVISFQSDDRPMTPQFQWIEASHLLFMAASDDWATLKQVSIDAGGRLGRAKQKNAGDPYFVSADDERWLVIKFNPYAEHTADEFSTVAGEHIEQASRHAAAVVYVAEGKPYEERVEEGTRQLEAFLKSQAQTASGPLRIAVPIWHTEVTVPAERREMYIRLELPIEN